MLVNPNNVMLCMLPKNMVFMEIIILNGILAISNPLSCYIFVFWQVKLAQTFSVINRLVQLLLKKQYVSHPCLEFLQLK